MDISTIHLYKTRMSSHADLTQFVENLHYLPEARWADVLMTVRRAGLVAASRHYAVERIYLQGHDLIYCVSGAGVVRIDQAWHDVAAGQLCWISGSLPHAHAANPKDPWTVMWIRLDAPNMDAFRTRLMGQDATINITNGAALVAWFQRLFSCMKQRPLNADLALHGLAADLLILLDAEMRGRPDQILPPPLARLIQAMSAQPQLPWSEEAMQKVARVSSPHLRRLFRQYLQVTPRAWLRRERIMLAQEMLLASETKIASIAEACGFADIYHFSKEFKKSVGQPPREWRQNEIGARRAKLRS